MGNSENPRKGSDFESSVQAFFKIRGLVLKVGMSVLIGAAATKKAHKFDLGSESPPVLVECKCHRWTEGGNSPSAKLAVWNEAMFYFMLAPQKFRKIFVATKSLEKGKPLVDYYLERYCHLIPPDVEIWEYDQTTREGRCVVPANGS